MLMGVARYSLYNLDEKKLSEENNMFRQMRRFKQQISDEECKEILKNEKRGVLSLIGDDGYPYGIPLNHFYYEKENVIYFHGAKEGHKIDAIKNCNKVSYCVYEKGVKRENHWSYDVRSVICFGKIHFVEDFDESIEICRKIWWKFGTDEKEFEEEIKRAGSRVLCLRFEIEHMTGKKVNES